MHPQPVRRRPARTQACPERSRRTARSPAVRWLCWIGRLAFALTFLLAMMTPSWKKGTFAQWPLVHLQIGGQKWPLGSLTLLPVVAVVTWAGVRLWGLGLGSSELGSSELGSSELGSSELGVKERSGRSWRWGPAHVALPVLGFGALTLARIWPIHQVRVAAITVVAIGLFWSAYFYVLDNWPRRWVAGTLAAFVSFQGLVGTVQFLRQGSVGLFWMGEAWLDPQGQGVSVIEGLGRRWMRAYGTMAHPNVLGGYLSMSLLICLGAIADRAISAKPTRRVTLGLSLVLGGLGLFFTFSRSAWLGMLAGLAYMAWRARPWRGVDWKARRVRRMALVGGSILAIGLVVLLAAYGDLLITRFFRLDHPLERSSIRERLDDVAQAWSLIRVVPFKGTGPGYYLGALWARVGEDRPPGFRLIHNIPLLVTAELGIGGLLLWLWLILAPPFVLARARRALPISGGVAAAFVSAAVTCMLDNYLYVPSRWWPALYLGVLAGTWAQTAPVHGDDVSAGGERSQYAEIREGFDRLAERYDREVEQNPAMKTMRSVSLAALQSAFRPGQRVIEIGCGTGIEAVALAKRGVYVLATDLSSEMLERTVRRAAAAGLKERIQTRRLAAGELGSLVAEYGWGAFDGAYSSFGALNGESDLRAVSSALATLIRPGGSVVVSVMNRFYALETLWYLAHGHLRQAVRRWSGRTLAGVSPELPMTVPTWYYTPRSLARSFPEFRAVRCRALFLLLPPPFLAHLWERYARLFQGWEDRLAHRWPFNAWGDHFVMVLERKLEVEG